MKIEVHCNTSDETLLSHVKTNSVRPIPWIAQKEAHDGHAVLVGGAPSIEKWLDEIRWRKSIGQIIFALNGAAKWLKDRGVEVDYSVVVDARDFNIGFVNHAKCDLLASQVHPSLFDASKNAVLWHQEYPDIMEQFDASLPENQPEHALIGGGTTVGLSAMVLAYAMGFRKLHLYGYDSSYEDDKLHAYSQDDPARMIVDATAFGRKFKTTIAMAKQAELFPELSSSLIELGCVITIRGDGLLPWMSAKSSETPTEQEKYQQMWAFSQYRGVAPGETVVDTFLDVAKPEGKIVDFGSGTGRGAFKIHQAGFDVTMLDFADNCLDKKVRDSLNERFTFKLCDLTKEIPVRGDFGYCTDVMEHLPPENVEQTIQNIMGSVEKCFFQISTVADKMGELIGHPLHLTVESYGWWKEKFLSLGYAVQWSEEQDIAALFFVTQLLEEKNA